MTSWRDFRQGSFVFELDRYGVNLNAWQPYIVNPTERKYSSTASLSETWRLRHPYVEPELSTCWMMKWIHGWICLNRPKINILSRELADSSDCLKYYTLSIVFVCILLHYTEFQFVTLLCFMFTMHSQCIFVNSEDIINMFISKTSF